MPCAILLRSPTCLGTVGVEWCLEASPPVLVHCSHPLHPLPPHPLHPLPPHPLHPLRPPPHLTLHKRDTKEEELGAQAAKQATLDQLEKDWKAEQQEKKPQGWFWTSFSGSFTSNVIANLQVTESPIQPSVRAHVKLINTLDSIRL